MSATHELVIHHPSGLHARPAALFVKAAAGFSCAISIENLSKGLEPVNGKSVLRLLTAAVQPNDRVRIIAEGEDEQVAVEALAHLIASNFGEAV
ncbi:HPr family phosphocarrier protein [Tengunoibacter tsumagoiensis]|uniref:Phosphocarrier protein HPr n=1 Tax=Tengunoibacter tsumagoiensis TaxID=2014871 RepID=A0A402A3D5_9CHLR|nr:HPr family phosphocarrier protein [Tengunoibacter tsumagoiensis]GCE13559.1 phosphotransferase [Tengunoibacter tsumagoiensis]